MSNQTMAKLTYWCAPSLCATMWFYAQLCGFMRNIKDAKHIDYTMNNAYKLKLKREQREESITTILCTAALAVIVVASWVVIHESFIYRYGV